MDQEPANLDPQRQQRALVYARLHRRLWAIELLLGGGYLLLWAGLGWSAWVGGALRFALGPLGAVWWLELLLMAVALGLPWSAISLPLDYYAEFVLPHRFGLSTQTLRGWLSDQVKGGLLAAGLGGPLLVGLYAAIRQTGTAWWAWASAGMILVSVLLAALAPVLLMPIFYRVRPLGEAHAELRQRLLRLAERAGARVEGVFTFDMSRRTVAANAALTGLGRTRRIILGDTLLASFSGDEIESVLAHELAHHVHGDITWGILVQSAAVLAEFYLASVGFAWAAVRLGLSGPADPAGLPTLGLLLGALGMLTLPAANAFSRWRESLADDLALRLTANPRAFASAMTRLANQNLAEVDPERWVVLLLHSHPPLRDRIRKAEAMAGPAASPDRPQMRNTPES